MRIWSAPAWAFVRELGGLGEVSELDSREDMALLAFFGPSGARLHACAPAVPAPARALPAGLSVGLCRTEKGRKRGGGLGPGSGGQVITIRPGHYNPARRPCAGQWLAGAGWRRQPSDKS